MPLRALSCLALASWAVASASASEAQRLAVVVPAHAGDLPRAVSALDRWPTTCSPVTKENVDLVLYYAEGEDDPEPATALETISSTAGRCFANTKLVYANLDAEEDVYPKGPSVQFYKMFLDEGVKADLSAYDALAIIEWDVLVASDRSFAELYRAAFENSEDFWVKGSNLEGTNFHSVAESSEMWHVMGHINGNAIYNNNDPVFTEFVEYTLARWEYKYPYDVALWATIADFPYSWPLWQRYSSKFVTTNLISNVGYEHVDRKTVSDAVAGETLFIHGSSVDTGNLAVLKAAATTAGAEDPLCTAACESDAASSLLPFGTSTICDPTCTASDGRFGGHLCGAGDSERYGPLCRLCYTDVEEAREAQRQLADGLHVIMCDTRRPPPAPECSHECGAKRDTVCDDTCGTGLHGDYNCNWRGLGEKCRFCFRDVETALAADEVAKVHGGRVVMCDTNEPPVLSEPSDGEATVVTATKTARRLTSSGGSSGGSSWKKWSRNTCLDGCERTSSDGTKGRVCDSSCETGEPYGRLGCSAKQGTYGRFCRSCYNDVELALAADTADNRAIMCDTLEPPSAYNRRQLSAVARKLTSGEDSSDTSEWQETQKWKRNTCLDGCERTSSDGTKGRVCDSSCQTGEPYGRLGCSAKQGTYGRYCRSCYNDVELALAADDPDNRAIMCDTLEPPSAYNRRQLSAVARQLTSGEDSSDTPKWKRNTCFDGCERTTSDGTKGRVCDSSCQTGEPYGRLGCSAKQGTFGRFCRTCYNDIDLAMAADTPDNRAIMCDTLEPPTAYNRRRLSTVARQLTSGDNTCLDGCERTSRNGTKGRVCDSSCQTGEPYGRLGCSAKQGTYGRYCRTCYNDIDLAMAADTSDNRAIMCDTLEPPSAYNRRHLSAVARKLTSGEDSSDTQKWKRNTCLDGCERTSSEGTKGRVCDSSCQTGEPYGRRGCSAKQGTYGRFCRSCYNDVELALAADTADNRAIMCDTLEPPSAYNRRQLSAAPRRLTSSEDSSDSIDDTSDVPKWKRNTCLDGCERTTSGGMKGRVCDSSCETGEPYGRLGCNAKQGTFGRLCRTCYNDMDLAMAADTADNRAIMCDTVEPVTAYNSRKLVLEDKIVFDETKMRSEDEEEDGGQWFPPGGAADQDFTNDLKRGEICVFVEGGARHIHQAEVAVRSVVEFMPGVRVAVATEPDSVAAYEMSIGFHTGVRVSSTPVAELSSLFADQHCGEGAKVVLYMRPGSVLSRSFTAKDTHTPRGELVVVYGDARQSYRDAEIARETAAVLGFDAPSFTYGTDLLLPSSANKELRAELHIDDNEAAAFSDKDELPELPSVPQLLAALAYSRNTEGVHFVNPQAWVTQNLFKHTSVWDIPLMKPRYACALPEAPVIPPSLVHDDAARADVLEGSLGFFRMGGSCENGIVTVAPH